MTPDPTTDVQLQTLVFTTPLREFGSEGKHWSPCASTLVTGETDAVLTDTGHIKSEVSALGDMIEQTGKRLSTIYITHGHLDHFLGIGQLMERFPGARPVATAAVVADIKSSVAEQEKQWQTRFGDDVDKTAVIPEPLEGNVIDLEGQELRVIEVPQGDISPSTVIHIPSIDTVIGGDVVYNRIHMMLALTGPAEWQKWIDSVDLVESLGASTIIAGHKQPDASDQDLATILDGSRGYIRDFRDAVAASSTAEEVVEIMKAKYEDYGNLTTLVFSARAALPAA
jgi:glyoxylase-like metal-dependent hydrolase (beta-lactamase superfamily II)